MDSSMLTSFFVLILSHLFADFVLQGETLATKKRGLNKYMLTHVTIVGFMFFLPYFLLTGVLDLVSTLFVFVLHLLIDIVKKEIDIRFIKFNSNAYWNMTGIDQMLHIATLYFVLLRVV